MRLNNLFIEALFKHPCHYTALLPYNLNWAISLGKEESEYLKRHPLTVADVGARGGAPGELTPFFSTMHYHAFDADPAECDRLTAAPHPYRALQAYPYFVGGANERLTFNLFHERSQSSLYGPDKRFKRLFLGESFDIDKVCNVDAATLDTIYSLRKLDAPDMIKLDSQGSELDVLRGATNLLKTVSLAEIEVEFMQVYEGQPLFHDISAFMMEQGFELLYLNRHMGQRKQIFNGPSRGQLVFGDALFGKREDHVSHFGIDRLVRYILLLINYGHIDVAFHLTQLNPKVLQELPSLERYFRRRTYGPLWKRGLLAQFDKLLLLLLRLRKTNPMSMDADRSWPVL